MTRSLRSLGLVLLLSAIAPMAAPAQARVDLQIGLPGLQIGVDMPTYPSMVRVPGYPVYFAPEARSNYFFHDGRYWVYANDEWYASRWYNGPWILTRRADVPLFVLRIPVRYYRQPPAYFQGWRPDAPPRWDQHWGQGWARQHHGWDEWDRRAVPAARPPPRPPGQVCQPGESDCRSGRPSHQDRGRRNQQDPHDRGRR